jgi:alcohol dehydrogenase class IV
MESTMSAIQRAEQLLKKIHRNKYIFGVDVISEIGTLVKPFKGRVAIIASGVGTWGADIHNTVKKSLHKSGVELSGDIIKGAAPNSPFDDVFRIVNELKLQKPDVILSVGGGSVIDANKAVIAYLALGDKMPNIYDYFGIGKVKNALRRENRTLLPHIAVMLASASGAHLTRYSNITDMEKNQKLLLIDDVLTPKKALFDYRYTTSMSKDFTMDGAFDGVSHCLEVYMGANESIIEKVEEICLLGIQLGVNNVQKAVENPTDIDARKALGLSTDLGGTAIMIGGTNGAHLNSFSMVDLLPHGRLCALMNPYYVVFFSPAIEDKLRKVGRIYKNAGYLTDELNTLSGRELGVAVATAMQKLSKTIGFPTTLNQISGFNESYIKRCLTAAKSPSLESKLQNMPVQLSADTVDSYMGPILNAAVNGDFSLIKNI